MKYFIDTEFIEGFHKPLFGKRRHFIDLISIGIVGQDGREYYAVSNEFDIEYAWNKSDIQKDFGKPQNLGDKKVYWLRDNVLKHLHVNKEYLDELYTLNWVKHCVKTIGKSNKQIAEDIIHFTNPKLFLHNNAEPQLEFYGYYSDYDWVLLCSLFGRMIDLPKGFPMYCIDLKQTLDEKNSKLKSYGKLSALESIDFHSETMDDIGWVYHQLQSHKKYPKETNEHHALADARWNRELYLFLERFIHIP